MLVIRIASTRLEVIPAHVVLVLFYQMIDAHVMVSFIDIKYDTVHNYTLFIHL